MFGPKITIDKNLHRKAELRAQSLDYSSISEYVSHLLEKDMATIETTDEEALAERLKGLGYL